MQEAEQWLITTYGSCGLLKKKLSKMYDSKGCHKSL